jgi:hypothetical protein
VKTLVAAAAILAAIAWPAPLDAQVSRGALVQAARTDYDNFETARALDALTAALNPALGPPDSTWAYGVQLMAQAHLDENRPALAGAWLRWASRVNPGFAIDSVTFTSRVVALARAVRDSVRASRDDQLAATTHLWPARGNTEQNGRLRVQSGDPAATVSVLIVGRGVAQVGEAVALPPGSYEVQASAPGFVPARVAREILPGVTSVVTFTLRSVAVAALDSVLPTDVRTAALARTVKVTPDIYGVPQAACGSGVLAGNGIVLTSYAAIRGADRITVELSGGRRVTDGVRVASHDVAADIAALHVPGVPADSIAVAPAPADSQYVWSLGFAACGAGPGTRLHTASATSTSGTFSLGSDLPGGVRGGAVITREGTLAGLGLSGRNALGLARARSLLATARAAVASGALTTPQDVATRESHRYGTLALSARSAGAVARVRPAETWHWPELALEATLPFTFAGPVGRYEVVLLVGGQARGQATAVIRPGAATPMALEQLLTQGPAATPQVPRAGGKFPWAIVGLGGAGAAVAALVLLKPSPEESTEVETGGISVRVPVR